MSREHITFCPVDDETETSCSTCGRLQPWFKRWVAKSREAQGLPEHVTDVETIRKVAALFGPAGPSRPQGSRRRSTDTGGR